MLGWEYPPYITGGLGIACQGLTEALSEKGANITFVVPYLIEGQCVSHMVLTDPRSSVVQSVQQKTRSSGPSEGSYRDKSRTLFPSFCAYSSPSVSEHNLVKILQEVEDDRHALDFEDVTDAPRSADNQYSGDMLGEVYRYTARVLNRFGNSKFDVIHAHDWMTFSAGVRLGEVTGMPVVLHVHSSDFDRSGPGRNEAVFQIEQAMLSRAHKIVAVSQYTKEVLLSQYSLDQSRIEVVHNGVMQRGSASLRKERSDNKKQSVLFLGRVTLQKGPEYFVSAAKLVLKELSDVEFIVAGKGDKLDALKREVGELGIGGAVTFTGFLESDAVDEAYRDATLFVMPSVSEPFGLAALEAIEAGTPVLISKQSGVGEVVNHALKFDFWDVEKLADLIINALLHEEMRSELVAMSQRELEKLTWRESASKLLQLYSGLQGA